MGLDKKSLFFLKTLELYNNGFNQKQISIKTGITEKTVSLWLREVKLKKENNQEVIKKLETRLSELVSNNNTSTQSIKNIVLSIEKLETRWFNKLIIRSK
jgi:hypothetical protein